MGFKPATNCVQYDSMKVFRAQHPHATNHTAFTRKKHAAQTSADVPNLATTKGFEKGPK